MTEILIWALLFTSVLVLVVAILLLKVVKVFVQDSLGIVPAIQQNSAIELQSGVTQKKKRSLWEKIMSLRPISEETDLVMEHKFDGIAELDNPTPAWFMVLFYGTIIFAIGYMFTYHVMDWGKLQEQEYVEELQKAEEDKVAMLMKPGNKANKVNENNVEQSKEPAILQAGATLFKNACAPCHGEHAQGLVGPNLTDEFWLHGGTVKEIFKTIKYGVPEKGMIAWEKTMSAKQISDISSYILSLQGSNPAGAKEPQGTKQ